MSAWDADCDALIEQGWGSHLRHEIPADWQTRRGPDPVWGNTAPKSVGRKRRSYAELRAERMRLYGQQRYGD